ncbi:Hypothetical predicted protein, partial [Paramuricea clavata]
MYATTAYIDTTYITTTPIATTCGAIIYVNTYITIPSIARLLTPTYINTTSTVTASVANTNVARYRTPTFGTTEYFATTYFTTTTLSPTSYPAITSPPTPSLMEVDTTPPLPKYQPKLDPQLTQPLMSIRTRRRQHLKRRKKTMQEEDWTFEVEQHEKEILKK